MASRRAPDPETSRREFLRFLLGSPLLAGAGLPFLGSATPPALQSGAELDTMALAEYMQRAQSAPLIQAADQAVNVFDLQAVAEERVPVAHYAYLATGVDDDATREANRQGFADLRLNARRLVDVSNIDMSVELFGVEWPTPIVIAPCGSQKAFLDDGELAVARAARAKNHLQVLSTVTTTSVEDVTAARGAPIWSQLYPTSSWQITEALLRRAEGAGCPVVVLTVDLPVGGKRDTLLVGRRSDRRNCVPCHGDASADFVTYTRRKPMFDGLDVSALPGLRTPGLTWDFVGRLKEATTMKVVVKGIMTAADARLCVENGADGIVISNHGGRAEESRMATIEVLPEIADTVNGSVPLLMDSGIRRGTDIFKALALGADAILIGRPYLWGLGAFGQAGVEAALEILRAELEIAMQQFGAPSLADINRTFIA
jgi:isopentenyl diphosphate isomerase/L-lactate dehydrogenase-like FMN-dependent dehydrogenase